MAAHTQPATAEDLLRLPRGSYRNELVKGELHRMSPAGHRHGRIAARLTARLAPFVEDHEQGSRVGSCGNRVVVVLDPRNKSGVVYRPAIESDGEPRSEVLAPGATLEVTDVVPGWSAPLANLFR